MAASIGKAGGIKVRGSILWVFQTAVQQTPQNGGGREKGDGRNEARHEAS